MFLYEQCFCAVGHYYENFDVHKEYGYNDRCPHCDRKAAWVNLVDETSGYPQGIIPISELENYKISSQVIQKCNLGQLHVIQVALYRVPSQQETIPLRQYYP